MSLDKVIFISKAFWADGNIIEYEFGKSKEDSLAKLKAKIGMNMFLKVDKILTGRYILVED